MIDEIIIDHDIITIKTIGGKIKLNVSDRTAMDKIMDLSNTFFEKCSDTTFYTEFEKKIQDIFGKDSIKTIFGLEHPDDVCIGYFIINLIGKLKDHKTEKTNQLIAEIEKKYGNEYFEDKSPIGSTSK